MTEKKEKVMAIMKVGRRRWAYDDKFEAMYYMKKLKN
jgi:hypothetical protein